MRLRRRREGGCVPYCEKHLRLRARARTGSGRADCQRRRETRPEPRRVSRRGSVHVAFLERHDEPLEYALEEAGLRPRRDGLPGLQLQAVPLGWIAPKRKGDVLDESRAPAQASVPGIESRECRRSRPERRRAGSAGRAPSSPRRCCRRRRAPSGRAARPPGVAPGLGEHASSPGLSRWRTGDADPVLADGDHRPRFQCPAMSLEHFGHQGNALIRRHVRQANQSGMGRGMHVDERCKVSIECHQNPASAPARASIAESPGSSPKSRESTTSWPWLRSHSPNRRPAHRSMRNFRTPRPIRRTECRWR